MEEKARICLCLYNIQKELKVPKDQYNSFSNFHYRSAENILEKVKPLLNKYKCVLTLDDEILEISGRFYVRAEAVLTDGESAISCNAYAREPESKKGMDAAQITGATSSYARKYALAGMFLLDDNKDADAQAPEVPKKKKAAPKKKAANKKPANTKFEKLLGEARKFYAEARKLNVQEDVLLNTINQFGGDINKCTEDDLNCIISNLQAIILEAKNGTEFTLA